MEELTRRASDMKVEGTPTSTRVPFVLPPVISHVAAATATTTVVTTAAATTAAVTTATATTSTSTGRRRRAATSTMPLSVYGNPIVPVMPPPVFPPGYQPYRMVMIKPETTSLERHVVPPHLRDQTIEIDDDDDDVEVVTTSTSGVQQVPPTAAPPASAVQTTEAHTDASPASGASQAQEDDHSRSSREGSPAT